MSEIMYRTGGRSVINCVERKNDPIALTWVRGDETIHIHCGRNTITISRSQLLELSKVGPEIAVDLYLNKQGD